MFIYVSRVFTAAATGSRLQEVTCEKCGKQFFYELSRTGVGSSSAPYFLGQNAARTRSQKQAAIDLLKRLKRGQETVPCPGCQWINASTVRAYRKTKHQGWTILALVIAALGLVVNLVVYGMSHDVLNRDATLADPVHWIVAAVWISVAGLCFLAQWLQRGRIDPNRLYNGKKRLPVGTPPAMIPIGPNDQGEMQYEIVPYDLTLINSSSKWAIFRAGQFALLPVCCRCLGEPSTSLRLPFVAQAQPIPVPMCEACRKTIIRYWWLANLGSLVLAFGIAWAVSLLPQRADDTQKTMTILIGGAFLAAIGFFVVDEFIRPYKAATLDMDRGISKIRFRNPAYTALLIRKVGEADGYFKKGDSTA